jgi:hypothetical protein
MIAGIGGGEPYHLTSMAPNGGFGELDNAYAQLRTIRVKSAPVADDRVDGARWEHSTTQRPESKVERGDGERP